jgi:AcrR family transcriptional regulator
MSIVESEKVDLRRQRGDRTRQAILESAAKLASVEGLEGLSIGRLADHLGISKSGLYAHFGSKEDLQAATVRMATDMYGEAIFEPALAQPPGLARLLAFADQYLAYLRDGPFPGGCFFVAASMDPARLRAQVGDLLRANQAQLLQFFEEEISTAQERGELPTDTDPRQLASMFDGLLVGADFNFVLFDDAQFLERGRQAVRELLAP